MALFRTAVKRDSVSLFRFSFLKYVEFLYARFRLFFCFYLLFSCFFTSTNKRVFFFWTLNYDKCQKVTRALPIILIDLNTAVIWSSLNSHSNLQFLTPNLCSKPLVTVLRTPTTVSIIVTFMFHSFLRFLARSRYCVSFRNLFLDLCSCLH